MTRPGDQKYATWYEPFDERRYVGAAVSFVLSYEGITGMAMVVDVGLVPLMLEAEGRRVSRGEAGEMLADITVPF